MKNVIALTGIGALALTLQACDNQTPPTVEETPVAVETEAPVVEVIEPVILFDSVSAEDWRGVDDVVPTNTESGTLILDLLEGKSAYIQQRNIEIESGDTVTSKIEFTTAAPVDLQLRLINNCDQDAENESENSRIIVEAGEHKSSSSITFENATVCIRAYVRAQTGDASIEVSKFVLSKD